MPKWTEEQKQKLREESEKLNKEREGQGTTPIQANKYGKGQLIPQISIEEAEAELDELNVDEWIKKHYDAKDLNIDRMSEILRESREEVYNRIHALGYDLPAGTYATR